MPRFHLDIIDGDISIADEEGIERPDRDAARLEAVKGLRSIIASEIAEGRLNLAYRIVIKDGSGEVETVSARDVVLITGL